MIAVVGAGGEHGHYGPVTIARVLIATGILLSEKAKGRPERRPFACNADLNGLGIDGGAGQLPPPFARRCPGWIPPDGRVPSKRPLGP
jgi:hypothetical protein